MNIGLGANSRYKQITAFLSTFLLLFSMFAMPLADAQTKNNPHAPLSSKQIKGSQINFKALAQGRLKIKLSNGKMIDEPVEGWDPDKWARYNELTEKINLLFGDAQKAASDCNKAEFDHFIAKIKELGDEVQANVNKDKKHEQALWANSRKIQDYITQAKNDFNEQLDGSLLETVLKQLAYLGAGLTLGASGVGLPAALAFGLGKIGHGVAEDYANKSFRKRLTEANNKKMKDLANMVQEQNKELLKQAVRSLLWNNLNKAIQIRLAQLQRYEKYFKKNCNKDKSVAVVPDTSQSEPEDKGISDEGWQDTAKNPLTDKETGQPLKDVVISITPKDSVVVTPPKQKDGSSPCRPFLESPLVYDPLYESKAERDRALEFDRAMYYRLGSTSGWSRPIASNNQSDNQLWGDWFFVDADNQGPNTLAHVEADPTFARDYSFYNGSAGTDCPKPQREPFVYKPGDEDLIGGIPINDGDTVRVKATCHEKYEGTVGKDKAPSTVVKAKPIKVVVPNSAGKEADIATVTKELKEKGIIVDPKDIKWKMLIKGAKAGPSVVKIPNHTKVVSSTPKKKTSTKPKPTKKKKLKVMVLDGQGKKSDIDQVIKDLKKKGVTVTDKSKVKWKPLLGGADKGPAIVTVPKDAYTGKLKKPKAKPAPAPKNKKIKVTILDGQGKYKDIDQVVQDLKKKGIDVVNKSKLKWKPMVKGSTKGPATVTVPPDSYNVITPKTSKEKPKFDEKVAEEPSPCPKVTDSGCCGDPPDENISYEPNRERQGKGAKSKELRTPVISDPHFHSKGSWGQSYDDQWALKRIGLSDASQWPQKYSEVIVAVIDTGIDTSHPDLRGSLWINQDEIPDNNIDDDNNGYIDDYYGWNFVDDNANIEDNNGHGTLTAGIIGAWGNNGIGIASVNPHARIMPVKVTDFDNKGGSIELAQGIVYAVENGARVINVSIGGKYLTKVEQAAVDYAVENSVVVVVASGNEGTHTRNTSPAGLPGVITVASTDLNDKRVNFSNWGPAIDLAAPGVDILSLRAKNTDFLLFENEDYEPGKAYVGRNNAYYRTAGSSFSAPFVAGVASLLLSVNPQLTADELKRMLLYSARDIDVPGKDQYTGYGLLDAQAALQADPAFYVDAEIDAVQAVQGSKGLQLQVSGKAVADQFKRAWLELGVGKNPTQWKRVSGALKQPVEDGVLLNIPLDDVRGASQWTIRLITEHKNGRQRENRYNLKLQ